jgi:predicted RNA polymerase sigma factor
MDNAIDRVNPQSTIILYAKANLLKKLNKNEEAEECFKQAEKIEIK